MGSSFSLFTNWWYGPPVRLLMLGLDAAGKTTILYRWKEGRVVFTIPTIGFNVESLQFKNMTLDVWDVRGEETLRTFWKHYYPNAKVVIYVIDSSDRERLPQAKEGLDFLLNSPELKPDVKILIINNKCDLEGSCSAAELAKILGVETEREWTISNCSAVTGEGLFDGLEQIYLSLTNMKKMQFI